MTNEQKMIDELREFVGNHFAFESDVKLSDLSGRELWYVLNMKLTELEQKYCKEEKKGCYACTECGHPHKLEDLIYFEGNGKIADEL